MNDFYRELLKLKLKDLSEKQRQQIYRQKIPLWLYPFQLERQYGKILSQFFKKITDQSYTFFGKLESWGNEFKQDGFSSDWAVDVKNLKEFTNVVFANPTTRTLVSNAAFKISDWNLKGWKKIVGKVFGVESISDEIWEKEVIASWANDNMNLLESLGNEYIKKINIAVSDNIKLGRTVGEIKQEILKVNKNMSETRARLIARDQTGKLNGYLTQRRMNDIGEDLYQWLTAGDERVRPDHKSMSNKVCKWSNSNVMSDDGKIWNSRSVKMSGSIPGSDIQCRCTAIPYMMYADLEKEIEEDKDNANEISK